MWFVLLALVVGHLQSVHGNANDGYARWDTLNYTWPSDLDPQRFVDRGSFIPENLQFSSVAGDDFVTFPRLKGGVPFTLTYVNGLRPWPYSVYSNLQGHCVDLQNPLATDIDYDNELLYILDNGHSDIHSDNPQTNCPPKIVALGTKIDITRGSVLLAQNLDPSAVSPNSVLLSFVLDRPYNNGRYAKHAYIADGGAGKIIVHDFERQRSWSFQDPRMSENVNKNVTFNNQTVRVRYGINALAMSPNFDYIYFTSTGSYSLYQIPTAALQDPNSDISANIRVVTNKMDSFVNNMASGKNAIYFTAQETNDIRYWAFKDDMASQGLTYPQDTGKVLAKKISTFVRPGKQHWPYALSIDDKGKFTWTSNRPELLYDGPLPKSSYNEFCCVYYEAYLIIWRTTQDTSYHYKMDEATVVG